MEEIEDRDEIIARVAALDIGKAELVCCVRIPGGSGSGRRRQEVATYSTMTRSLLRMVDRLRELAVTRVAMEATSDYWKSPYYLLEAAGFEVWLVNAKDVKHLPGRPKTDAIDAAWLCKVTERQMIRPSFVPPAQIRQLRDLTRYRVDLVAACTAEKQRAEKLLEDACIKVSVVVSDLFASRTDTFLGERYRRIARRRGKKKAIVAVGRSILVIVWHLLADPDQQFHDLGADYFTTRIDRERKTSHHIRQLQTLGYQVTLEAA